MPICFVMFCGTRARDLRLLSRTGQVLGSVSQAYSYEIQCDIREEYVACSAYCKHMSFINKSQTCPIKRAPDAQEGNGAAVRSAYCACACFRPNDLSIIHWKYGAWSPRMHEPTGFAA